MRNKLDLVKGVCWHCWSWSGTKDNQEMCRVRQEYRCLSCQTEKTSSANITQSTWRVVQMADRTPLIIHCSCHWSICFHARSGVTRRWETETCICRNSRVCCRLEPFFVSSRRQNWIQTLSTLSAGDNDNVDREQTVPFPSYRSAWHFQVAVHWSPEKLRFLWSVSEIVHTGFVPWAFFKCVTTFWVDKKQERYMWHACDTNQGVFCRVLVLYLGSLHPKLAVVLLPASHKPLPFMSI